MPFLFQSLAPDLFVLLLSLLFYLLGLMIGRWLNRRVNLRLSWTSHLFIASFSVVLASRILRVEFPGSTEFALVAIVTAAFPLNALLHRFVWPLYGYPGENARIPSFLPQVVSIVMVVFVCLLALALLYHVTIPGLLAGSGVIAIIIGLALQDNLGNIFAGMGLQAGNAYKVGDWLILDGQHVEVVEITWRSTRLRNNDDVSINIPNNQLAKATIINLYYPTPVHAQRVRVNVDNRVPPNQVKEALLRATTTVPGVLHEPAAKVYLVDFTEAAIRYEIKFWSRDGKRFLEITDRIRTNIWYELGREQIRLAFPTCQIELTRSGRSRREHEIDLELIASQPLFDSLDQAQLRTLENGARHLRFGSGETIIREGEPGDSMYILSQGKADVLVQKDGQSYTVGSLEAGDCFGEISMLTGEPRSATVVAKFDCEVVEIQKDVMANLLRESPGLAESLSGTLAVRRSATEALLAQAPIKEESFQLEARKATLMRRLRQFFEL